MSIMVGVGRGASAGVLVKNAEALETLARVDTLVVDKTGTLTEGRPRLVAVAGLDGNDDPETLRLAASLERGSEHPLAGAIVEAAEGRASPLAVEGFASVTGRGVRGTVEDAGLASATRPSSRSAGSTCPARRPGGSRAARGPDGRLPRRGQPAPGAPLGGRPAEDSAREAVRDLRAEGIDIVMLTGDNRTSAAAVARALASSGSRPRSCRKGRPR